MAGEMVKCLKKWSFILYTVVWYYSLLTNISANEL